MLEVDPRHLPLGPLHTAEIQARTKGVISMPAVRETLRRSYTDSRASRSSLRHSAAKSGGALAYGLSAESDYRQVDDALGAISKRAFTATHGAFGM